MLKRFAIITATGFGSGYSPVAPGSVGTLVGIPVFLLLSYLSPLFQVLRIIALGIIAVYTAGIAATAFSREDPREVVIDEIVGFQVALFLITPSFLHILAGYLLFRFFDIVKLFPANRCEKFPGGYGIVLDDIMAGIYSNIVLWLLIEFAGF